MLKAVKKEKPNFDDIEWMEHTGYKKSNMKEDEIMVTFYKQKKDMEYNNTVKFRFGTEILEKLKWQKGDTIAIFFDKNNEYRALLVKNNGGNGYTLQADGSAINLCLSFIWKGENRLKNISSQKVDWDIIKGTRLTFEFNNDEDTTL